MDYIQKKEYLAILMERYENLIYSICYRITSSHFDAQDLAQETFLSAYKSLSTFDGRNEQAWLCRIATNKCLDYMKSAGKQRCSPAEEDYFIKREQNFLCSSTAGSSTGSIPVSLPAETGTFSSNPEQNILEKETMQNLETACHSLKPPYDEVSYDYFYKEMTMKEIAEKQGKKLKTIQTQVGRARNLLKKKLGGAYGR